MKNIILYFTLILSCNSALVSNQDNLPFQILLEGGYGGRTNKEIVVITNKNELTEIYNVINANLEPDHEIPTIDFNNEIVLAFFMGEISTGGFSTIVKQVKETHQRIEVYYQEISPKPTDMVTYAITQPYCIIKIKKVSKELKFIKTN